MTTGRLRPVRTVAAGAVAVWLLAACGTAEPGGHPAGHSAASAPAPNTVVTSLLEFQPEKLTVKAGTTVSWKTGDRISHTVTTGAFSIGGDGLRSTAEPDGQLDLPLTAGENVSFTFDSPGTYTYFCTIHRGMSGIVEVTP